MTGPLRTWDWTMKAELMTREEVTEFLNEYCVKWCFQKEEGGETGYVHWQVRMTLKKKLTESQLKNLGRSLDMQEWHLSPTASCNRNSLTYVLKADTRIEGPWQNTDKEEAPRYIPRQVRDIVLLPWQQSVIDDANNWDTRVVNVVYCPNGNIGKSTLATWGGCRGLLRTIPAINNYKDIMRLVMDLPTCNLYLIDMPRAINQKELHGMYAALEEIKGGHAWDDRYEYKDKWFDCPNIWVFCNNMPDLSMLSIDRWKIWNVIDGFLQLREQPGPLANINMRRMAQTFSFDGVQ